MYKFKAWYKGGGMHEYTFSDEFHARHAFLAAFCKMSISDVQRLELIDVSNGHIDVLAVYDSDGIIERVYKERGAYAPIQA